MRRLHTIHVCAPCDTLFSFCLCLVVQAATVPRIRGGLSTLSMAHFVNNKVGTSLNLRPRGAVVRTAHSFNGRRARRKAIQSLDPELLTVHSFGSQICALLWELLWEHSRLENRVAPTHLFSDYRCF